MSKSSEAFRRPQAAELARRLREPRRFLQVVAGPRQVGKSTLVQQVVARAKVNVRYFQAKRGWSKWATRVGRPFSRTSRIW